MRCPRCSFEGEPINGTCPQCGYRRVSVSESLLNSSTSSSRPPSSSLRSPSMPLGGPSGPLRSPSLPLGGPSGPLRSPALPSGGMSGPLRPLSLPPGVPSGSLRSLSGPSRSISLYTAKSGDTLSQGRYRLVDQLILPDNQQGQGAAWLAVDTAAGQTQVVIREVVVPAEDQANKKQIARSIAMRLSEAAQHSSFPKVLDVFNELDNYFIVLQHVEGESLASLLRRQGGALPERTVAEYGRQLCEMLVALSHQQPPLVHGAISPETVIVSPDRSRVHLIHLPLFPPRDSASAGSTAGYKAPEQARGVVDPASDLYSVAATMHHAVTGFDPRERIAFFYPPARRLNPVVSQQMETILAQELRLSSPQRYARAVDMQTELATLLAMRLPEPERRSVALVNDPLKMDTRQIREQLRKRSRQQLGIFVAACALILLGVMAWYIYPYLKISTGSAAPTPDTTATMTSLQNALNHEWQVEAPSYQTKQIGLSDGRYAFDTYPGRLPAEVNYKKTAAQALLHNDVQTALNNYSLAVTNDKTDAEARIYYEDLQIETANDPYITIVLGLPLDGGTLHLSLARPDLQSAFEFQDWVNTQNPSPLPGGVKLRILIGNSGADNSGAQAIAHFVAQRVQLGNLDHIVGVVGWPTSGESTVAISTLASAKIPIITQTASSTALDGSSPYFFRVNPTDAAQGKAQGRFAYKTLGAKLVLVLRDTNDPYSQSLADAFTTSFTQLGGKVVGSQADYFTEGKTTVAQFEQQVVKDAVRNRVDLIFLPGFDVDAVRLAHALGLEAASAPWNTYLTGLKILGGDGLDTGLILGNGVGPDAQLAKTYTQDMQRLVFTSFANPAEWGANPPEFMKNWTKLYGVVSASNPNPPTPINTAIMTYDAFGVYAYAMGLVKGPLTGESLRGVLAELGKGNLKPFQGISGLISFGNDGDPLNKAVVLLQVAANGQSNGIKFLGSSVEAS